MWLPGAYGIITRPKGVRVGINQYLRGSLPEENVRIRDQAIEFDAVIRLIRTVIQDAYKGRVETSVCGEMASEPESVMLLLGLGIPKLSMAVPMIPEIKQIIRSVTAEECNKVARKVLGMNSERQISSFLRDAARKILPEAF